MSTFNLLFIILCLVENALIKAQDQSLWMTLKNDPAMDEDLKKSTVLIVKDEELKDKDTSLKKANQSDLLYSDKRYLMCLGSVLTHVRILTSASCMHKATYIRHNIEAPLAAVIHWSDGTKIQVIAIKRYVVHEKHIPDPRNIPGYQQHNIALAILGEKIQGDDIPMVRVAEDKHFQINCINDACFVPATKKIGKLRFEMEQINPANTDPKIFKRSISDTHTDRHILRKRSDSVPKNVLTYVTRQGETINVTVHEEKETSADESITDRRSQESTTDEVIPASCVETGSPVMIAGKIQVALLIESCDNRQPHMRWYYTDLYENKEWISKMQASSYDYHPSGAVQISPRMSCLCSSPTDDAKKCSQGQNTAESSPKREFNLVPGGMLPYTNHPYTRAIYNMYLNKECMAACSSPCGGN